MASCAECGEPVNEGAWTCGKCGAPIVSTQPKPREESQGFSAYYKGPDETPPPELQATGSAQAGKSGLSRGSWMIIGVGIAVVLAIFVAWFFFLRNGDANAYVGTWIPVDGSGGLLVIAKSGGGGAVTMTDEKGQKVGPLKAHMNGGNLEFDLTPAGGNAQDKAAIEVMKALLGAFIKDLKFVAIHNSSNDTLSLKTEGKPIAGGTSTGLNQTVQFKRAGAVAASPTP
jgi:hypothetical protein